MFACTHHLLGMLAMQWRRGGKNHRIGPLNTLAEISGMIRDCVLPSDLRGILLITTHEARDFHARYALKSIEVLLTEGTLSCHADLHRAPRLRALSFSTLASSWHEIIPASQHVAGDPCLPTNTQMVFYVIQSQLKSLNSIIERLKSPLIRGDLSCILITENTELLIKESDPLLGLVPCIVENGEADAAIARLRSFRLLSKSVVV